MDNYGFSFNSAVLTLSTIFCSFPVNTTYKQVS